MTFWEKAEKAFKIFWKVAVALFLFLVVVKKRQPKTDVDKKIAEVEEKTNKLKQRAHEVIEQVHEVEAEADRVKEEIEVRKAERDKKAEQYFGGL